MFYQELLEVYFGENQNIKEMQDCISKLRKVVKNNKFMALNTNKYVQKFNRLAEKEWGFKCFSFTITDDFEPNAYTIPVLYDYRMLTKWKQKNLLVSSNGFKYKPEAKYCACVYITRGLFTNDSFTDREIFSIILHEIGHNFSPAISDIVSILSLCSAITYLLEGSNIIVKGFTILSSSNIGHEIDKRVDDFINEHFPKAKDFCEIVSSTFSYVKAVASELAFNFLKINIPMIIINYINNLSHINIFHISDIITGYRDEKVADSFATMYGYGPDAVSSERKLQTNAKNIIKSKKPIPLISPFLGLCDALMSLLVNPIDEHPNTMSRIIEQSEYLKRELEKEDIDPKLKKEIISQVKEIDKVIDNITKVSKKDMNEYYIFFNVLNNMNMKLFKGDFRDKIYNSISTTYDDIEKVYNRKMNESNTIFMDVFNSLDD